MNSIPLRRHIGLTGAVFTLVGYVIGASIFVLPALSFAAIMGAGVLYYAARRRTLAARGQQLDQLFAHSLDI